SSRSDRRAARTDETRLIGSPTSLIVRRAAPTTPRTSLIASATSSTAPRPGNLHASGGFGLESFREVGRGVGSGRARILVLALGAFVVVAGTARGQDREPSRDDPSERNFLLRPTRTNREPSPPSTYDPSDEAPPPDAAPPPVAPRPEPKPGAPAPTESPSSPDDIVIKANGRVRLELGYDSNVFRAERGASGDGFFHGYGEAQVLVTFPEERELFASVSGEGLYYFKDPIANETYASTFVDYYHPLSPIFDVDVQNTFEYSAQNL